MSRLFYHVMQDNVGNLLFDVSGTMRIAGSGTFATIYGDEALTVILPNPMTNHPSFGSFKCFLGAGDYDFYMAKAGYTFETLTGVQGHGTMAQQDAASVAITGGTLYNVNIGVQTPTPAYPLDVNAPSHFNGPVGMGASPVPGTYILKTDSGNVLHLGQVGINIDPAAGKALHISGGHVLLGYTYSMGLGVEPLYTFHVNGNAGIPGGAWVNTTSLAALKREIAPLTGALALLTALQPRRWRWALDQPDLEARMPGEQAGFVVEDVQEVQPQWTPKTADGTPGLAMRGLEAYLVAAVQELAAQVQALTARLEAAGG